MLACLAIMFIAFPSRVMAEDIGPQAYYLSDYGANWSDTINGITRSYPGFTISTTPQGTWNSPFIYGVDAFGYNDSQDYTEERGPHGDYLTTSHKCRECHGVHRASGKFKLTRANTRFESCDWCHGGGAGSGFNIQTDNDSDFTKEYNGGHSMGYGIASGRWMAPDDTYPAYTPVYWLGGFSCFDCHSPHANKQRMLGYSDDGSTTYPIYNPGYENVTSSLLPQQEAKYPAGSWLLIKNPDRETDPATGNEIPDTDTTTNLEIPFSGTAERFPVHKYAIDWNRPIWLTNGSLGTMNDGFHVTEFCADCHDANAGLSTQQVAAFSEDRALHGDPNPYDVGTGHDSNEQMHGVHYVFDPEDDKNNGPTCRSCHRGSSDCSICHDTSAEINGMVRWPREAYANPGFKHEKDVSYPNDWRTSADINVGSACCNDGFDWPHKTLSWKMLKDNLFGVDFDGETFVGPGETRSIPQGSDVPQEYIDKIQASGVLGPVHDLDSVCLDCHNPNIWNPQYKNDLLLKGLP